MKTARVILGAPEGPPFKGAPAIINHLLNRSLRDLGFELSCSYGWRKRLPDIVDLLPLPVVQRVLRMQSDPIFDLEIRCDGSLGLFPLLPREGQKNVVFFHGLAGSPGQWIGNEAIDGYWCNSEYMVRVLTSFLAAPNWDQGRLLDPRAFSMAGSITLPLPLLELPEELVAGGQEEIPRAALEAMEGNDLLGCCVSEKLDDKSTYGILLTLNQMALQSGLGRRFRLFVEQYLYNGIKSVLESVTPGDTFLQFQPLKNALEQLHLSIDDILIPIPRLAQTSLFKVVKACKFSLLYHWVPDSFGLFPLELVCQGCPVYTNGAGNLRYLVPEGHGISVLDTEGMAFGDLREYQKVAQKIFHDTVIDHAPIREACSRGAEYVSRTYNREAMRRDLEIQLKKLDEPPAETELNSAILGLSPLVRSWNPKTRRLLSDYQHLELTPEEAGLLEEILGQRCADLDCTTNAASRESVDRLFQQGVLTLLPPAFPSQG